MDDRIVGALNEINTNLRALISIIERGTRIVEREERIAELIKLNEKNYRQLEIARDVFEKGREAFEGEIQKWLTHIERLKGGNSI